MRFQSVSLPKVHQSLSFNVVIAIPSFKRVSQIILQRRPVGVAHFVPSMFHVVSEPLQLGVWLFPHANLTCPWLTLRLPYLVHRVHNEGSTFHGDEFMRLGTYYRPRVCETAWTNINVVSLTPFCHFGSSRKSIFACRALDPYVGSHILPYSLLSAYLLAWLSGGIVSRIIPGLLLCYIVRLALYSEP